MLFFRKLFRQAEANKKLYEAAGTGNIDAVSESLNDGANVDCTVTPCKTRPLMIAAAQGHVIVLKKLIDSGASVDLMRPDRTTALMAAAMGGQMEAIKTLIEAGASRQIINDNLKTAAQLAAERGHKSISDWLVLTARGQTQVPNVAEQPDGGTEPVPRGRSTDTRTHTVRTMTDSEPPFSVNVDAIDCGFLLYPEELSEMIRSGEFNPHEALLTNQPTLWKRVRSKKPDVMIQLFATNKLADFESLRVALESQQRFEGFSICYGSMNFSLDGASRKDLLTGFCWKPQAKPEIIIARPDGFVPA